jgi:hypothetical protein
MLAEGKVPRGIVERREKLLRPAEIKIYAGPIPGEGLTANIIIAGYFGTW